MAIDKSLKPKKVLHHIPFTSEQNKMFIFEEEKLHLIDTENHTNAGDVTLIR